MRIGNVSSPNRLITLQKDGTILAFHGDEAFWSFQDGVLLLMDASRTVVSFFDMRAGLADGTSAIGRGHDSTCHPGYVRAFDFAGPPIWISRAAPPAVARPSVPNPLQQGPLPRRADTPEEFLAAWNGRDDFTVVLDEGVSYARPASPCSLNLGSTPVSHELMDFMLRKGAEGYAPQPSLFHVLNDCWLVDGTVAITKAGYVIWETSQLVAPVFVPVGDIDFYFTGQNENVSVLNGMESVSVSVPSFLFNTIRHNYGSWLLHSVPNWIYLDWIARIDPAITASLLLVINGGIVREEYRAPSLDLLDLANPVLAAPKGIVHFRRLVVPSFHRFHSLVRPGVGRSYRKMAETALSRHSDQCLPKRIYASRKGQTRGFVQQEEIESVLQKHRFVPIVGGSIPFSYQVAAYGNAEAVFGSYGSNMQNAFYAPAGAKVIEVIDEIYGFATMGYTAASANQQDYCCLISPVSEAQRHLDFHSRSFELPAEVLDDVLTRLM